MQIRLKRLLIVTVLISVATILLQQFGAFSAVQEDSSMPDSLRHFRTQRAEDRYFSAYDRALSLWPIPYSTRMVNTRWGETHVILSGRADSPPVVLLHGMSASSTMWHSNVESLSQGYRVIAIDTIGTPGKSVASQPIEQPEDFVAWLDDVLEALDLSSVSLVGHSHGGWVAAMYAMNRASTVRNLTLLAPAASLRPLVAQFYVRALLANATRSRALIRSFLNWSRGNGSKARDVNELIVEQILIGIEEFRTTVKILPTEFSDEELQGLSMPTLVLIGDQEAIYDPREALDRASVNIPKIEIGLIEDAGHGLFREQSAVVTRRIVEFIARNQ
jgi:pimeloyl-ACP methyl ester carboxylesterase